MVEESREVRLAFPPEQRFVPAKREEGHSDVDDMLACHGWPARWAHRRDGASSDTQALRRTLLGMCVWYLLLLHLQPYFLPKVLILVDRWIGLCPVVGVASSLPSFLAEFSCRFLLCGWTLLPTCTTTATTTSFPGIVER